MELQVMTGGDKGLHWVTGGYKGLQEVTTGYRGLQEVTRVTGVMRGYRG